MRMVVAVTVAMLARMAVRVTAIRGVGMGVHRVQVYSTILLPRVHPEAPSCYWKL